MSISRLVRGANALRTVQDYVKLPDHVAGVRQVVKANFANA